MAAEEAAVPVEALERRAQRLEQELAEARAKLSAQERLLHAGRVLSIASRVLGSVEAGELDGGIVRALGAFGAETGVDAAMVCQFSRDRASMESTHGWPVQPALAPSPSAGLRLDELAWTTARILALEVVHVPRVAELPEAALGERRLCALGGLRSVLFVPLVHRSEAIGFVSFASIVEERAWSAAEIALARMLADLVAGALERGRSSGDWAKVFECLRSLGADSGANVDRLTALIGGIVGGTHARFERAREALADGRLRDGVLRAPGEELVVLRELASTAYAETDPSVRALGLRTYVGRAIRANGVRVGALCVAFQRDFEPSADQRRIFHAIADAIAVEEVRKRAHESLEQAVGELESTLDATADGILVADVRGRPLRQNRRFRELWRIPDELGDDLEAIGRHRLQMVKDPWAFLTKVADLYTDAEHDDLTTIELNDGRTFERYSRPMVIGGAHAGRVWSVRDVTDRTRRDEELRHTMALLEATFEATADGVLAVDAKSRPLRFNRRFLEVWAIPPELAAKGDGLAMLEHAVRQLSGRDVEQEAWRRLAADPHASEFTTLELADGRVIERYSIPLAVGGAHLGRVFSFRDVTERARGEASRVLLATAVEQAGEAVVITDRDGAVEYVNPTFERLSGHRLEALRGRTPRVLKSGRHEAETYRALWETISSGSVWAGRLVNRRADGTLFEVDEVIAPVRTADGTIGSFVGILRDVTREHQLEEEVRQAQKMEAVGRLAGGIAHDFNNLLTAIIGYAEMIDDALERQGPIAEDVREIRRAADRAATLTRQLLAFSRRQVLQPRVLDLNEVLASMEKMLRRLIPESVTVRTAPQDGLLPIKADRGQIEQVVLNLALNARDAMPDAGRLTLTTENARLANTTLIGHDAMPPGPYVRLSVADDGHGMDGATLARIFEPFFTTKGVGKGTGLGLATVYGIVRQSGGAIQVESRPGAGTTFQLYLPVCTELASTGDAANDRVPRAARARTILLVEDEDGVRAVAAKVLRAAGHRVLEAADGLQALELADANATLDAVITDVVMPRMGGPELIRRLCAARPSLPVLFMSGHVDASVSGRELPVGAAFLPKPFEPEALRRAVHDLLDPRA